MTGRGPCSLSRRGRRLAELAIFHRHAAALALRLRKQSDRGTATTLQRGEPSPQNRSPPARSVLRYLVEHATRFVEALYPDIELLALIWQLVYRPGGMRSTMFRR